MSITIATVDLSTAVVGSTDSFGWAGKITPLQQLGWNPNPAPGDHAHLRLFNESGCGLKIETNAGRQDVVPAGAWPLYQLDGAETQLTWTVSYVLPGAPVSTLFAVLYQPGEAVPATPVLGNSPIGIGGTVATSTTNQVINDGNAAPFEVVEATPSGAASSQLKWNNDGSGVFGGGNASVNNAGIFTLPASAVPVASIGPGTLPSGVSVPATSVAAGTLASGVHLTQLSSDSGAVASDGAGELTLAKGLIVEGGGAASTNYQAAVYYSGGNSALALASPLAGASQTGMYFAVWDGSAVYIPFSIGAQYGGASAWVSKNGDYIGPIGGGIPMTRNGAPASVPLYTGTSTPVSPPTGAVWVKA